MLCWLAASASLALLPFLSATTYAAFTATTVNATNEWSAGSVVLDDDDSNTSMFSATGLVPGSSGSKCIAVTYNGTLAATVKLYATGYSTTKALGPYLNLTIEEGTGSTFAGSGPTSCPGFTATATLYEGTLADFAATKTSHANGIGSFAPNGAGQTRVFRISYRVDYAAPEATQSGTAAAGFTWEART